MPTQNWREVYELALLELDTSKLPGRVEAALRAIQQRLLQKETLSRKECEETDDALRALCRGHATARGVSKQRWLSVDMPPTITEFLRLQLLLLPPSSSPSSSCSLYT